ncbi:thiamine-phosphate kinase [soil metagenome]
MRLGPGPEFDLIRRFVPDQVRHPNVRVGPGDDCAVVSANGLAISTDLSVEGTHFRREWLSGREIGGRATIAALSDLAAVAARPIGVLASLALPEQDAGSFAEALMGGVRAATGQQGAVLLGGDLARTEGPVVVDIVVVGECSRPVLRSGARPGDELWVTGELGGSAAALRALLEGVQPDPGAFERFARPTPRIREALWLAERNVPAAMLDLSDGLGGDAAHLAAGSGVAVVIQPLEVPLHACATVQDGLSGGEDYELCFAARAGSVEPHAAEFRAQFGIRLTRVGHIEQGAGVWEWSGSGGRKPLRAGGFQHLTS